MYSFGVKNNDNNTINWEGSVVQGSGEYSSGSEEEAKNKNEVSNHLGSRWSDPERRQWS